MKRRNYRIIGLTILAGGLLTWGVLSLTILDNLGYRQEQEKPVIYRLAFVNGDSISIPCDIMSEYWRKCIEGVQVAACEKKVAVSLMSLEPGSPYSSMADIYDSAILAQMDGIICVGFDQDALGEKIDAAAQRGIPTVCIDGDVPASERIAYIGTDNYAAGVQAAKSLLALSPEPGAVYVIYPGYVTPQFSARAQGFIDIIQQQEGYSATVAGNDIGPEQWENYADLARSILLAHDNVTALFCPGTSAAVRIARIVLEEGLRDQVRVICMDDYEAILQAVQSGLIDVTIVQQPFDMGYQAVRLLCDYLDGTDPFPIDGLVYTGTYPITRTNVASYLGEE